MILGSPPPSSSPNGAGVTLDHLFRYAAVQRPDEVALIAPQSRRNHFRRAAHAHLAGGGRHDRGVPGRPDRASALPVSPASARQFRRRWRGSATAPWWSTPSGGDGGRRRPLGGVTGIAQRASPQYRCPVALVPAPAARIGGDVNSPEPPLGGREGQPIHHSGENRPAHIRDGQSLTWPALCTARSCREHWLTDALHTLHHEQEHEIAEPRQRRTRDHQVAPHLAYGFLTF